MINFVIMLEDLLNANNIDYELLYIPESKAYVLKYDGLEIGMFKIE